MLGPPRPPVRDLVLLGGGHSHVEVLRSFGMRPLPGVRLTLISRDLHTPYSGMLPGYVAGFYSYDDVHIDLARLAAFASARLVHAEACGLDTRARRVALRGRPPMVRSACYHSCRLPNSTIRLLRTALSPAVTSNIPSLNALTFLHAHSNSHTTGI